MKILILGASGMLGNAMIRVLSKHQDCDVWGTARSDGIKAKFSDDVAKQIITGIDVENVDVLTRIFAQIRPAIVINCIGLVKQLAQADDPLQAHPINALLPHRLSQLCAMIGARLVHISTDCVFSGRKGGYIETDDADAQDLYGRSKFLGEVNYPHAITLRTSIIGHELNSAHGLICWFLAQQGSIKGFTKAIFSGLPTCELATVISDFVIPNPELHGVFHVAADPISKFELLQLVNTEYGKGINIEPDTTLKIDRSLNAERFQKRTGYKAPSWPQLISHMRAFEQG